MSKITSRKVLYEAMWFDDGFSEYCPIVRGYDMDDVIKKMLLTTKNKSGEIELYRIIQGNKGHSIELMKKFTVIDAKSLRYER